MSLEDQQKLANYASRVLGEHFDTYVVVGTIAGTGDCVVLTHAQQMKPNEKVVLCTLLANSIGSVQATPEPE